jgi:tetratricopeptide (TPR) repeat protein
MSSPIDSVSLMERGKFKINQHEFKLAEQAFLEEAKANPKNHEAWFYIGFCRKRLYRIDEAVAPFEKAIELKSDDPDYLYEMALTYRAVKMHDKAINTAKTLQKLDQKRFSVDQVIQLIELVSTK